MQLNIFISDVQLGILARDLIDSKKSAYAASTQSNLWTQWQAYIMFYIFFKINIMPATSHNLCLFAQFLSRTFKTVDSIKNYMSGVNLLHIINNQPCPTFSSIQLTLVMKGIAHLHPHMPKQAFPIHQTFCLDCTVLSTWKMCFM